MVNSQETKSIDFFPIQINVLIAGGIHIAFKLMPQILNYVKMLLKQRSPHG